MCERVRAVGTAPMHRAQESPDPCSQCCVGMQRSEFSEKLITILTLTAGVGGDFASNFSRHLSKGNFLSKAGAEVSGLSPARWDRIGVF